MVVCTFLRKHVWDDLNQNFKKVGHKCDFDSAPLPVAAGTPYPMRGGKQQEVTFDRLDRGAALDAVVVVVVGRRRDMAGDVIALALGATHRGGRVHVLIQSGLVQQFARGVGIENSTVKLQLFKKKQDGQAI